MQFEMKTQTTALVLCALFLSAFGHDVFNRHQTAYLPQKCEQRVSFSTPQSPTGVSKKNDNSTSSSFQFITNFTTNLQLVAEVNVTAAVAVVFDISHSYVVIFCGVTGNVIVINLETKIGGFLSGNSSHHGWIARTESFDVYLKSVTSFEPLYKTCYSDGEKFTVRDASPKISQEFKLVRVAFSRGEFFVTKAHALERFIHYSEVIVKNIQGPLNENFKSLGNGVIVLQTSLRTFIVGCQIFGEIFSIIKGGSTILVDLHLNKNLSFNSQSWLQMLTYLFSKLKEHNVDVKPVVRHYADNFPVLLVGLAGNSTEGTNGPMRILAEVRAIILGKRTADALVDVLLEYFSHSSESSATLEDFVKELQCSVNFLENIGVASELQRAISYARGMEKGHLLDLGIDLYKITEICFDRTTLPLRNVVSILSLVQKDVSIENSIGFLLYRLIGLVVDDSVDVIRSLIPRVEIDSSVDFLVHVFGGARVGDLKGSLYEFLRCRPVFGQIFRIIDSSLRCNNVSLKEILASPHFRKYRCVITKMLAKVIRNIEEGGQGSTEDARQLKSHSYGFSGKHFGVKTEHGKHLTHAISQVGKTDQKHEKHDKHKNDHGKQHKV